MFIFDKFIDFNEIQFKNIYSIELTKDVLKDDKSILINDSQKANK